MKALFCTACGSLFSLSPRMQKSCECGTVVGGYDENGETAYSNGQGVAVAFGNGSMRDAILKLARLPADRRFYPIMAWVRPHDGPTNPHSRVETA